MNGQVTYSSDVTPPHNFGAVATFSCDAGFRLNGDASRVCGGDGSSPDGVWSDASPTCIGKLSQ